MDFSFFNIRFCFFDEFDFQYTCPNPFFKLKTDKI